MGGEYRSYSGGGLVSNSESYRSIIYIRPHTKNEHCACEASFDLVFGFSEKLSSYLEGYHFCIKALWKPRAEGGEGLVSYVCTFGYTRAYLPFSRGIFRITPGAE